MSRKQNVTCINVDIHNHRPSRYTALMYWRNQIQRWNDRDCSFVKLCKTYFYVDISDSRKKGKKSWSRMAVSIQLSFSDQRPVKADYRYVKYAGLNILLESVSWQCAADWKSSECWLLCKLKRKVEATSDCFQAPQVKIT